MRIDRAAIVLALMSGGVFAADAPVTFNKDVAPIVFKNCTPCHRAGEVAPFPLFNFGQVKKRASLIGEVVRDRAMPPWKAVGDAPHFADSRRLSDADVATIAKWIEAGAPEGNAADLPPAPKFAEGWQFGEPDMVVKMAEPYSLAADGPDVYRNFVIPVKLPAGKYLRAVEYRPGNRKVVHHAVHTMLLHGEAMDELKKGDGKSFGSGLKPVGQLLPGQLAFWTPGMFPRPLPDGLAAQWPGGVDLVLQLHLHPSGKVETEQSSIGLYFTDKKPTSRFRMTLISNPKIRIPAGDSSHEVSASRTLRDPVDLYGVFPHMHLIGKKVHVEARLPDGSSKPLLAIDDWDFNWQNYYQYAAPIRLPAGTKIEGRFVYDNSASNPANPSKPPKVVEYGEQTVDEMAIVLFDALPVGPSKKPAEESKGMSKP